MLSKTSTPVAGGPVLPTAGKLHPLSLDEITITGGFWGARQQVNADATLLHCRSWMDRIGWIDNFDKAAAGTIATQHAGIEFVDSEVYKLLEAMAWEISRRPSVVLEAEYADLTRRVVGAQEKDGYLHTSFGREGQPQRYSNLEWGHELYCFGHLFQAAVARLRTGHDDALPQAARRLADHVWTEFGPGGRDAICGHPEIEMGLIELGRAVGERRYIELGKLFIDRRGYRTLATTLFQDSDYFLDDEPVRHADVLRGHAVRAVYLGAGAVDAAMETGDAEMLAAVQQQAVNTVARRTYLTGGIGAHHQNEAFGDDYELPADRAYAETCAAIGSVMLHWRLLLATGEPRFADMIERTLFNAVLVGSSEDGRAFFYSNTLHQRELGPATDPSILAEQAETRSRAPWFEVSCCPTNIARTLSSIAGYFATKDTLGVQLHQYGNVEIRTTLESGVNVHIRVTTNYPNDGQVRITTLSAGYFEVRLRVPVWAANATCLSDAKMVEQQGSEFVVRRSFAVGDGIDLCLPMPIRTVRADPRVDAVRGAIAFERGPLVLCIESPDLPEDFDLNAVQAQPLATEQGELRLTALNTSMATWPYSPEHHTVGSEVLVPLRPYASWGNRGISKMRVWLPEQLTAKNRD